MKPDIKYIQGLFDYFNNTIFEARLVPVRFELVNAKSYLAQFVYPANISGDHRDWAHLCSIRVSRLFDYDVSVFEDTLIHEMIHYSLWLDNVRVSSAHDVNFRRMMDYINTHFNRHVVVSEKSGSVVLNDNRVRMHIFCVTQWSVSPDKYYITPCGMPYVPYIDSKFRKVPTVSGIQWYLSSHPWFNGKRKFRTPKAICITDEEYKKFVVENSVPYTLVGSKLYRKRME